MILKCSMNYFIMIFSTIEKELNIDCFSTLANYKALSKPELDVQQECSLKYKNFLKTRRNKE